MLPHNCGSVDNSRIYVHDLIIQRMPHPLLELHLALKITLSLDLALLLNLLILILNLNLVLKIILIIVILLFMLHLDVMLIEVLRIMVKLMVLITNIKLQVILWTLWCWGLVVHNILLLVMRLRLRLRKRICVRLLIYMGWVYLRLILLNWYNSLNISLCSRGLNILMMQIYICRSSPVII